MANIRHATVSGPVILIIVLLIGAISFAAALDYNSLIQALIRKYGPDNEDEIIGNLINVGIVTLILVTFAFVVYRYYPKVSELV